MGYTLKWLLNFLCPLLKKGTTLDFGILRRRLFFPEKRMVLFCSKQRSNYLLRHLVTCITSVSSVNPMECINVQQVLEGVDRSVVFRYLWST